MTDEIRAALTRNLSDAYRDQIRIEAELCVARARVQQAIAQITTYDNDCAEDRMSETLHRAMHARRRRLESGARR